MVWALGTLVGIGKGLVNATAKSFEFGIDIAEEVVGIDDEYDGVWGSIWGSWEDNILGASGEEGAVQHLFGEEGAGGRFFGAIPEAVRSPAKSVINPVFDAMDIAYEYGVDRNLGTLIGVTQRGTMDTLDVLMGRQPVTDIFTVFDPNEWRQAYNITEARSFGQAIALASKWIDLDNPAEVERFEGTAFYKMYSGMWDAVGNIILDPANLLFGAGMVGAPARAARKGAKTALGMSSVGAAAIKTSKGFARFDDAIEVLRYAEDLKWSDQYKKGIGFADSDLQHIDTLTARIHRAAQDGKLGRGQKARGTSQGLSTDQARAIASLPNKAARDMYFRLSVTGGDMAVMDEMVQAANAWGLSHQTGGLHHQLYEVRQRLANSPFDDASKGVDEFYIAEQSRLENLLMQQNPELPFGAALSIKEERLRALGRRSEIDRGYIDPDEFNARHIALNEDQHLVQAATDQVLLHNHVDSMEALPKIGAMADRGFTVRTFVEKTPLLGGIASSRVVHAIVEKVPQGIILWDDAQQGFTQFQRMLRDASRVGDEGLTLIDDAYIDQKLGAWTGTRDTEDLRVLFETTVDDINHKLVDMFSGRMEGVNKNELNQILQRQWKSGEKAMQAKARSARQYAVQQDGYSGIRIVDAAEGGETMARYMPITTKQLEQSSLIPRYDLYKRAFQDSTIFAKGLQRVGRVTAASVNGFTTVWKRSVLLRPAWPMRVLLDEYARTAAEIGTLDTIKSMAGGFNDLKASWFRKQGVDLGPLIQKRMVDNLDLQEVAGIKRKSLNNLLDEEKAIAQKYKDAGIDLGIGFETRTRRMDPTDRQRMNEIRKESNDIRKLKDKSQVEEYFAGRAIEVPIGSDTGFWKEQTGWQAREGNQGYYDLVDEFVKTRGTGATEDLVRKVISDEYGRKKVMRRSLAWSAGAGIVAGPAGLAIGGLYSLHARSSLSRLAKIETANAVGFQLRAVARTQLHDEIASIRNSVLEVTDPQMLDNAAREIENLNTAASLLEAQAKTLTEQNVMQLDGMKDVNAEMYDNFDKSGQILADAGVANAHIGGVGYANAFGNSPQQIEVYRKAISADSSNRVLYGGASEATRKTDKLREPRTYNITQQPEAFVAAFNDTVNKQWVPFTDEFTNNAFQDFQRLVWQNRSDEYIIGWLRSKEGDALRKAMPEQFKNIDEHMVLMRQAVDSFVPNDPRFSTVRAQAGKGRELNWNRDIQPVIDRHFEGSVEFARRELGDQTFGQVIGDSYFGQAAEQGKILAKVQNKIDTIFQNIGTMPTDILTRSLVFRTAYAREMARRLTRYEDAKVFRLKESDIRKIEKEARGIAIKETKHLLYDLAERSKFEEVVSNIMPFYGAWQEVITRWTGLAQRNPSFVMAGSRNFRKAIQTVDAKDENGDPVFVLRLPEGVMNWKIPFLGVKAFGRMSALGDNAIDFNFGSASMISAGLPGFGPMISIPASETALQMPELGEALELILPFGPTEGDAFLQRVIQQTAPTWIRTTLSTEYDTPQRQRMKARITADLAAEYYEQGETIDNETEWAEFEDEINRRARDILTVRALGNLGLPLSFIAQSPHYHIINGYNKIRSDKGLESADEWLITKHPEMWAIMGRQTAVKTVASATLEGEALYQETKEFADNHSVIGDWIVGKVGTLDAGFVYNRAVQIKEINEGRRVRLTPREIYTRAAQQKGWFAFRDKTTVINNELFRRGVNGLSVSLNAKTNEDLAEIKRKIIEGIAAVNPQWKEEYDSFQSDSEKAEVIHSFRSASTSPLFERRPDIRLIRDYVNQRDLISRELERREEESGNPELGLLGSDDNYDLKELWLRFRLRIAQEPDFASVFVRYFDRDDSITRSSWPTSWMVNQEKLAA